jgi:hypothetical protein
MRQVLPFLDEELKKKRIFNYFSKKKKNSYFFKNIDFLFLPYLKKTKYTELSEIFRFIHSKNTKKKKMNEFFECDNVEKNNLDFNNTILPSLFLKTQTLIKIFLKNYLREEIYCFFVEYSLFFKFYETTFYLIQNLERKTWKDKNFFIRINIIKIDFYFSIKNFKKGKNIINFLNFLVEKDDLHPKNTKKIFEKAGKLAIRENKMLIAFSYFLESFGKTRISDKNGHNKVFEFLVFISNFIKKQKINAISRKNVYNYNISNFVFLEFIAKSLQNKNLAILESSFKEKNWNQGNWIIKFFLSKFFNSTIRNSIKIAIKPFLRISLGEFSVLTGVKKKKLKIVLSKMILKGEIKGILDQEIDSFVAICFAKNSQIKLNFLEIIVQMNHLISEFI